MAALPRLQWCTIGSASTRRIGFRPCSLIARPSARAASSLNSASVPGTLPLAGLQKGEENCEKAQAHLLDEAYLQHLEQTLKGKLGLERKKELADDASPLLPSLEFAPKEIELVMTQTNVSRNEAIKALQQARGDVVDAIMLLMP